ncbi:hydroxysqualene dehydroxylase HpnE [Ottowia caeni]|uniref:hydroxysqualene dehydroxylase HpnE n=1 Tax=Ottowia caeni TaxID=2870339 RepID=UPI003D758A96|nr:hydroxysqualene dehydroxylase HpnE [Ottowia caeni]
MADDNSHRLRSDYSRLSETAPKHIAIIGAGWAGMAAAVRAVQDGHRVTILEAARTLGGRARGVPLTLPDGREISVDNGQHILIGAYAETLRLMRIVGVDPQQALLRFPMALTYPDGTGLSLPDLPTPLDALVGILRARGWNWREKLALLRVASRWQRAGFRCDERASVADLCVSLPPRLMEEFIDPLCVSALNTPVNQASGAVFLRVLRDGLFSHRGGSNFLLPRCDLSALFPDAAASLLKERGVRQLTGRRVDVLERDAGQWRVEGELFDSVVLAVPASESARILNASLDRVEESVQSQLSVWAGTASALRFKSIATVYAQAKPTGVAPLLSRPMLALRASDRYPAQFVFDRDQITPSSQPSRLLAFVISVHHGERSVLEAAIVEQAKAQLGLSVKPLQTIVEKRATFACTPALVRPPAQIASGLVACGDYIEGPYPATLEGAVRSGWNALGCFS